MGDKNKQLRNEDRVQKQTKSCLKCWTQEVECVVGLGISGVCIRDTYEATTDAILYDSHSDHDAM